jgi:hypothetical protein
MNEKEIWKVVISKILKNNEPWDAKNNSEKYHVAFERVKMPPKVVYSRAIDYILEHHPNTEVPLRMPGGVPTNQFIEEQGFKIEEDLIYNQTEEKKFLKNYKNKIINKVLFQEFIEYANHVLKENNIESYKVRMAIKANHEVIMVVGMRDVLSYREVQGRSILGIIVGKGYTKNYQERPDFFGEYEYKGEPEQGYLSIYLNDFQLIDNQLLKEHSKQVGIQFDAIKNSKFTQWNVEANTTNSVLKYLMFRNENVENWIHKKENKMKNIKLNGSRIYKLSMGTFLKTTQFRKKGLLEYFENNSMGVMHEHTANGQGNNFKNKLKIDDYVYITYGREKLGGIYRVISEAEKLDDALNKTIGEEGYLSRKLELIAPPKIGNTRKLVHDKRSWLPSGFSTLVEISGIKEANQVLFLPYYDVAFEGKDLNNLEEPSLNIESLVSIPLNQVLYGPPGTGKTYYTKELAVKIANPKFMIDESLSAKDQRIGINNEYNRLFDNGQIVFTTFHQSLSYEDFVEGIKPFLGKSEDKTDNVEYGIEAGIFKQCAAQAAYNCYKLSNPLKYQAGYTYDDLYDAFIDQYRDSVEKPIFKTITGKEVEIFEINKNDSIRARARGSKATHVAPLTKENLQKLYDTFNSINEIKNLQQVRDAVGVRPRITEFYAIFRAIKQFENKEYKNVPKELMEIENPSLDESEMLKKFGAGVFNNAMKLHSDKADPIVLIIDEINRGNVSAIFGELITLLEPDKRIGKDEAIRVKLPYSKTEFGVPSNLFIIGTMNTADRSVESLDTALRRRFSFQEIMPNQDLLKDIEVQGINLKLLLETINLRIEALVDRDHTIGHSYFFKIKDSSTPEQALIEVFRDNIIPLLQEYFFGDYSKVGLVLGDQFVKIEEQTNQKVFANFDSEDSQVDLGKKYKLIPSNEIDILKIKSIINND